MTIETQMEDAETIARLREALRSLVGMVDSSTMSFTERERVVSVARIALAHLHPGTTTVSEQLPSCRVSLAASAKMLHFLNFEFDPEMDVLYLIAASEGAFIRLGFYREQVEKIGKQLFEAARLMK